MTITFIKISSNYALSRGLMLLILSFASLWLSAQCDLNGNYNTNQFQAAIDAAEADGCTTITLNGTANWSGGITIPNGSMLVVSGTATINGNGTITSQADIEIEAGGTFNINGNDLIINGVTISGGEILTGPIPGVAAFLPVELLSFTTHTVKGGVNLSWATSQEIQNDYYSIHHSEDGKTFTLLAEVQAKGNSQQKEEYSYLHQNLRGGNHYYRLSQTDYDGTTSVLGIRQEMIETNGGELNIFPNPVTAGQSIVVDALPEQTNVLFIFNAVGQKQVLPIVGGQVQLPFGLPVGLYYLRTPEKNNWRSSILMIE